MGLCLLAVLLTLATGWCLVAWLWPSERGDGAATWLLRVCLSILVGFWASSCACFIAALMRANTRPGLLVADVLVLGGAVAAWRWRAWRAEKTQPSEPSDRGASGLLLIIIRTILLIAVAAGLVLGVVCWLQTTRVLPHGAWDAWSVFNLKARFIFRGGEDWPRMFSDVIPWAHPDYPLLLPMSVARLWIYMGREATDVPAALALGAQTLLILTLFSGVAHFKGAISGALAALILLGTAGFLRDTPMQLADAPFAEYLAAAVAAMCLALSDDAVAPGRLVLAGVLTGAAAWTKNEGDVMALALVLGTGLTLLLRAAPEISGEAGNPSRFRGAWNTGRWLLLGLAAPLAMVLIVKLVFAYRSHLVEGQSLGSAVVQALAWPRHAVILTSMIEVFILWVGPLQILVLVLLGLGLGTERDRRLGRGLQAATIALPILLLGYYGVFLVMSQDLQSYLRNSLSRLDMQVWPPILMVVFLWLKSPDSLLKRKD